MSDKVFDLRAMTPQEIEDAARSDPDARPLTREDLSRMSRTPQAKIIRRSLGLTQEQFSDHYQIPLGTLRDWEQGRTEPDQPARAYLEIIAYNPDGVLETWEAIHDSLSDRARKLEYRALAGSMHAKFLATNKRAKEHRSMSLQKHQRTRSGTFRRERADSRVKELKKEYPELRDINGNMKLGTLRKRLGVDSLDQVLKKLRSKKQK